MPKRQRNAVERLKDRISDRLDAERDKPRSLRKTQRGLADHIGIKEGTLSELLKGPSSSRGLLAYLDGIADYFHVPPSLLVHKNDTALMELQPGEYKVLQHWRRFPIDVQESMMALFDYFGGLMPEEKEIRRLGSLWARLTPNERENIERTIRDQIRGRRILRAGDSGAVAQASSHERPAATAPRGRAR